MTKHVISFIIRCNGRREVSLFHMATGFLKELYDIATMIVSEDDDTGEVCYKVLCTSEDVDHVLETYQHNHLEPKVVTDCSISGL